MGKVCYPMLKIHEYCQHLRFGFSDGNEDVQMMAFSILAALSITCPQQLVPCLDSLKENMLTGVKDKLKLSKGDGADAERAKDVLKSIVKSLYTVMKINGVEAAVAFVSLY